jgi:hypothetical protein
VRKVAQWFTRVDPLAEKYASISPYVYVANNPIIFIDPDGREIINGHAADLREAQKIFDETQEQFNSLSKEHGKKAFRIARTKFKEARKTLGLIRGQFLRVQEKIKAIEEGNQGLFNTANTLEDEGGNEVDIYVYDVLHEKLQEGRTENAAADVYGDTDANFGQIIVTSEGKKYMTVTSRYHPDNVTIRISNLSKVRHLAHEFGHAIYQTQHTMEYFKWLKANPDQQNKGGHGDGDPSGKAASVAESFFE